MKSTTFTHQRTVNAYKEVEIMGELFQIAQALNSISKSLAEIVEMMKEAKKDE